MSKKDELAGIIADELNKQFKHQKVAYFLEEGGNPTDVTGWISTGSTMLDLAISNKPNGGVAVGKITELNGLEGSGKSLIDSLIFVTIVSIVSNISSQVSRCTYSIFLVSTPIALKNS